MGRQCAVAGHPGELPKESFKGMVKALMVERGETDLPTDRELEELFIHADEDKGGTIDEHEFVRLYKMAEVAAPIPPFFFFTTTPPSTFADARAYSDGSSLGPPGANSCGVLSVQIVKSRLSHMPGSSMHLAGFAGGSTTPP